MGSSDLEYVPEKGFLMHVHLPPIEIAGFDHPYALVGIAPARRPAWGATRCATCSGRGARNEILHLDSMRCRLAGCADCEGAGWLSSDGARHRPDIVLVNGAPAWTTSIVAPAAKALPACLMPPPTTMNVEPLREYAEAA